MSRRPGTSHSIHHSTDYLDDSIDATLAIERLIALHDRAWVEGMLRAMGKRKGNGEQVRELVVTVGRG